MFKKIALIISGLALLGCQEEVDKQVSQQQKTSKQSSSAIVTTATETDGMQIELLEDGSKPRKLLRYKLSEVKKQSAEMLMKMKMSMQMDGQELPMSDIPTQRMIFEVTPEKSSTDKEIQYKFVLTQAVPIEEPGANPTVIEAIKTALKDIEGLSGQAVVTDRGFTKSAVINIPNDANPQTKQTLSNIQAQIEQMSSPFPEQPVGVGAKWRVTQKINQNGIKMTQKGTYILTSYKNNTVFLDVVITQEAPQQDFLAQGGYQSHLNSLKSSGRGQNEINFSMMIPKAKMNLAMKMDMSIDTGEGKQNIKSQIDIDVTINGNVEEPTNK